MDLYNLEKDEFTRGEHQGESMTSVAEDNPDYLLFLTAAGTIDESTIDAIVDFIEINPEFFEDLID